MERWRAYIDESYDSRTFCVGGFLARATEWAKIERAWEKVVIGERVRSQNKGFPPITGYHATDCANLQREFSAAKGWNISRQIRFTKRLCDVIARHRMAGFVVGGGIAEVKKYLPPDGDVPTVFLYSTCFKTCLLQICGWLDELGVESEVEVFYERSGFDRLGTEAFEMLRGDSNQVYRAIVSAEPKGWETCVPIQLADFMVYAGFKIVGSSLRGKVPASKVIDALTNSRNEIMIAHFQEENFADIMRMIENNREGRPLGEGVRSSLRECEGHIPYIPKY